MIKTGMSQNFLRTRMNRQSLPRKSIVGTGLSWFAGRGPSECAIKYLLESGSRFNQAGLCAAFVSRSLWARSYRRTTAPHDRVDNPVQEKAELHLETVVERIHSQSACLQARSKPEAKLCQQGAFTITVFDLAQ
jgi:hypothetical protein